MPSIVNLEQAATALKLHESDAAGRAVLQGYVDAITPAIEDYKHEVIAARAVVERVTVPPRVGWGCGVRFRLWSVPLISVTSITSLDGLTTWPVDSLDVESDTGMVEVISGPAPCGRVKVTYQAGYAVVPENYVQGALVVLQQLWEARRSAGQAGVTSGAVGAEESRDVRYMYTFIRKAREWLGPPRPIVG